MRGHPVTDTGVTVMVSENPPGAAEELVLRVVSPGQARRVVAVFWRASQGATALRGVLRQVGLAEDVVRLVPSMDDAGRPVVLLTMTLDGLRRLVQLLGGGPGPPPGRRTDAA